jgi:hypothetical protein
LARLENFVKGRWLYFISKIREGHRQKGAQILARQKQKNPAGAGFSILKIHEIILSP